jgi:predicted DNA-binding transcriptional regulator AlpA
LPASLPPRGLNREQSAAYVGVSPSKFDEMVKDGRMPAPIHLDARRIWDRRALDRAFDVLAGGKADQANEWDQIEGEA